MVAETILKAVFVYEQLTPQEENWVQYYYQKSVGRPGKIPTLSTSKKKDGFLFDNLLILCLGAQKMDVVLTDCCEM